MQEGAAEVITELFEDFGLLAFTNGGKSISHVGVEQIRFESTFDQSVTLLFGIAANCIATWALGDRVGRNTMLPGMCAVSFLLCVYNTLNTVFLDQTTGRYERYGLVLLFGLGVAGTYWLLMSRPEIVLGDRFGAAADPAITAAAGTATAPAIAPAIATITIISTVAVATAATVAVATAALAVATARAAS